jgi:polyphosphate kinase
MRVLEEAQDITVPLMERLTFAAIFSSNLDEFYMVRVGTLTDQLLLNEQTRENKTNMTPQEQLNAVFKKTDELVPIKGTTYFEIMQSLQERGIREISFKDVTKQESDYLEHYFVYEILPLISAQVIDKRHPFPFLKNKDIHVIAKLESKSGVKLGIIQASGVFDRLVILPGPEFRFILVEELILHFASKIFDSYKIQEKALMRVTRNADINAEEGLVDYDLDFRSVMSELIKKRKKLSPVRLEITRTLSEATLNELCKRLELKFQQIFLTKSPLEMSFVFTLKSRLEDKRDLFFTRADSQKSPFVNDGEPMTKQIQKNDILLSYPYESMKPFIRFLQEVSADPKVVSIKITLYRVAQNSKIIEALIDAAENGKEVLVLVELRARFDEENNIGWSKRLETAGCHVIYGPENLKVHSKLLLVTRKSGSKVEFFTHVGTGNYNEKTATLYTDLSLMTANTEIALEAAIVFNALSLGNIVENTKLLLVAPMCLQSRIIQMLEDEINIAKAGLPAYFGAKINSLSDKVLIEKIIEASQAGVKIDLIVRGICCLVSGVSGITDNITVTSIVGRYLEHSRIYIFGIEERCSLYISSADFMTRNTTRRVEVAAPVLDKSIRDRLLGMFSTMLRDNAKARVQHPDGEYYKKECGGELRLDSQAFFFMQAYKSAQLAEFTSQKSHTHSSYLKKLFEKIRTIFKKTNK